MPEININIDDHHFQQAVAGFTEYLHGTRSVMIVIGRGIRDASRDYMRSQGRGSWPGLARWTTLRTGRTTPLKGLERMLTYDASADRAVVYARKPLGGNWDLDLHARGYITPARRARYARAMRVPMYRGKPVFRKTFGPSVVPPRPWMPPASETVGIAHQAVADWVAEGARKKWR